MGSERKKLRFEIFIERYFGNFHRVLLTNILFAVPSAVVFAIFYFISQALFKGMNVAFSMLMIIFLYPFYSGVVMVARNIARGDEKVKVFPTFINAIRVNFPRFILHGVLVCAAAMFSYYSLSFYIGLLSTSWLMYVILFFCILIVLLALFTSFYIPLMDVTYDIKLRYLYKNSALMSFGEFKNNFFALIAVAVVTAICFTVTAFSGDVLVLSIVLAALWILFLPATFTYGYCFFIYDGMAQMMTDKQGRASEIDSKIADKVNKNADKPQEIVTDDFSDIDISSLKDTDDFIFHNGRMIKQSALLRMLREKENGTEVDKDE